LEAGAFNCICANAAQENNMLNTRAHDGASICLPGPGNILDHVSGHIEGGIMV
jgi:hypothetical protein